jgi:hypothetical protein
MALHRRSDFARLCGKDKNWLTQYIKRGKVILSGELVDDKIDVNAAFMEKWQSQLTEIPEPIERPEHKARTKVIQAPGRKPKLGKPVDKLKPKSFKDPGEFQYVSPLNQLDQKIKETELARKEEDLEIAKLKRAKMAGEVVPVDLVRGTFARFSKSLLSSFQNEADNLLMEFASLSGLTREQVASMRGRIIKIVNKAVNDGCDLAEESVSNIVQEYSNVRGQGDRLS